jgi:hypothetical protein
VAVIQVKEVTSTATSINVSFDTLPAIGRSVVVVAAIWPQGEASGATCTDNQGHTPTKRMGTNGTGSSGTSSLAAWSYTITASSGTFTITVAGITNAGSVTIHLMEVNGTYHAGGYDTSLPAAATAASVSLTTTQPNCELVAFMTPDEVANPVNVTEGGGFTLVEEQTDNNTASALYSATRTVTATGTYTPTWTWSSGSWSWLAGVMAFDTGGGASGFGALLADNRNRLVIA